VYSAVVPCERVSGPKRVVGMPGIVCGAVRKNASPQQVSKRKKVFNTIYYASVTVPTARKGSPEILSVDPLAPPSADAASRHS
jgi:hypothetical protein